VSASTADHFGLLVAHPTVVSFAPRVSANQSDAGPTVTLQGTTPVFAIDGGPDRHLLGILSADNELYVHAVESSSLQVSIATIGCASSPIRAGAVRYGDGWLVAYSNGQFAPATGVCASSVGAGQPTRIDIVRVHATFTTEYHGSLEFQTPIIALAVAPHPSGVYVVWRQASGGIVAPIRWVRFEPSTAGWVGPGEVSTPADFPLELTATALGENLAVAYGSDPAGNPADIVLKVQDPFGTLLAEAAFEPPFYGPLALIGSPDAQSLVVGFSGGGAEPSIELARFDCVLAQR
jgi:hypothetical protein